MASVPDPRHIASTSCEMFNPMEQRPTSPVRNAPILASAESALAADPRANCCAAPGSPRKLDLTGMAAPGDLKAARLEEFTIDGICGVY